MPSWRERIQAGDGDARKASCWAQCAVGEQHALMPEVVVYTQLCTGQRCGVCGTSHGGPEDGPLYEAGVTFWEALELGDLVGAEMCLDAIEDRVLQLKRESRCG